MIETGDKLFYVEVECVRPKNTWLMCYQGDPQVLGQPLAIFVSRAEAMHYAKGLAEEFGSHYRVVEAIFAQQIVHEIV